MLHDSAAAWAADASAAERPRLEVLETHALQGHPGLVALSGEYGALVADQERRSATRSPARSAGALVVALVAIALLAAPAAGMGAIFGDQLGIRRLEIEQSAPFAAVCFVIAALVQVGVIVHWARRGRPRELPMRVLSGATAALGVASLLAGTGLSAQTAFSEWPAHASWIGVGTAAGAVALVVQLVASRRDAAPVPEEEEPAVAPRGSLRDAIARLDGSARDVIRADRDAGVDILLDRGLIDADLAERARRAPLGTLHELDRPETT